MYSFSANQILDRQSYTVALDTEHKCKNEVHSTTSSVLKISFSSV